MRAARTTVAREKNMKTRLRPLVAACTLAWGCLFGMGTAAAGDVAWFVAPEVNALWLDDKRNADDDVGITFNFGLRFSEKWEAQLSAFTSEHDMANDQQHQIDGFGFSVNRLFYPESRIQPYFTVGLAKLDNQFSAAADNETMTALFGGGLRIKIGEVSESGSGLAVRASLGARRSLSSEEDRDYVDYVAGLGVHYSWGGTPPPPPPTDTDGDGVMDDQDKCPGTPSGTAVNSEGCPLDSDGDGVNDTDDKCPATPAGAKVDATGCELDSDGDGVGDSRDECPNSAPGAKVNEKGCELDTDGDGVADSQDKCPDTPKGDRVDAVGCSFKEEIKLPGVVFETNKAELKPESLPILEQAAATLKRYPDINIEVAGHTDDRGTDAHNLDLSARRADTVMKYLQDAGVTNAITSRGYGERQPMANNRTEEGRQQNRRVVLRVLN
jgi:OOP family OmpA-OmpF porin